MNPGRTAISFLVATLASISPGTGWPQPAAKSAAPSKVIIDTDIGDDIDDVFAISIALTSPELKILGITSAWGDTALRTRMLDRLLCETGREDIPVRTGIPTKAPATAFSQRPWASKGILRSHGDAVDFLLEQIRMNPGEITLIAVAPLTNIGAAIERDPVTFRRLKRVVLMGGSVYRGYGDLGYTTTHGPSAEYNIAMDRAASKRLFTSGVPIFMMPLDSTQLKFDEVKRSLLASVSTPLTDSLQVLTAEWTLSTHNATPTMFDAVAAAYAVDPAVCPTTPLHIEVDDAGFTRVKPGPPNVQACLEPHTDAFFSFIMPRLLDQQLYGKSACSAAKEP